MIDTTAFDRGTDPLLRLFSSEQIRQLADFKSPDDLESRIETLAEKAAWEFIAAHKSEISWDLVVINPPWLFGASLIFFFFFFRFSDTPSLTVPRVFTALAQPRADGRGHQHFSTRNL